MSATMQQLTPASNEKKAVTTSCSVRGMIELERDDFSEHIGSELAYEFRYDRSRNPFSLREANLPKLHSKLRPPESCHNDFSV
jgi:hypothetical protein